MIRDRTDKSLRHLFSQIIVSIDIDIVTARTLIDFEATYNFVFQHFVKRYVLSLFVAISNDLSIIDDTSFRLYQDHFLNIKIVDCDEQVSKRAHDVFETNLVDIDLILDLT